MTLASFTMKAAPLSSVVHGGGKRRVITSFTIRPAPQAFEPIMRFARGLPEAEPGADYGS
jgi:hypothetical protein